MSQCSGQSILKFERKMIGRSECTATDEQRVSENLLGMRVLTVRIQRHRQIFALVDRVGVFGSIQALAN